MPIDREYAKQVFSALQERGNDMQALGKELDRLDPAQQEEFIQKAGAKVGLSAVPAAAETPKAVSSEDIQKIRQQNKEPQEVLYTPEQMASPEAGGFVSGLTSGIVPKPAGSGLGSEFAGQMVQGAILPAKKAVDAATGAISGFTSTQGSIPQKLAGAAGGALLSLGFGIAARGAGKLLAGAGELPEKAARQAVGVNSAELTRFAKKGTKIGSETANEAISTLKPRGLFSKGTEPRAIQESVLGIKDAAGMELDGLFAQLDASGFRVSGEELSKPIREELDKLVKFQDVFPEETKRLQAFVETMSKEPEVKASELRNLYQTFGDRAFDAQGNVKDEVAFNIWKSLKDATDNIAGQVGGDTGKAIAEANKTIFSAHKILPGLAKKVAAKEGAPLVGIISSPLKTAGKAVEEGAVGKLVGSAEWIQSNIKKLGKFSLPLQQALNRGARSVAVTWYQLMQNPEFNDKVNELEIKEGTK